MEVKPLRWGICGAGKISHDFIVGLKTLSASTHQISSVAARSIDSANKLANTHSIPKAYGSYDELATDPDIDVVYIGTIHQTHLSAASKMLEAGKPVLCEKPLTMNAVETRTLIDLARGKNLFLMEGMWTRFIPVIVELRRLIRDGVIGDIQYINGNFSCRFQLPGTDSPMGTGSVLDIGVYVVHFATMLLEGMKPEKIYAQGILSQGGYDELAAITLKYATGCIAQLTCGSAYQMSCEVLISGTKGEIKVPNPFWCPKKILTPQGVMEIPFPEPYTKTNYTSSEALCYEAEEVRQCLMEGKLESTVLPLEQTQLVAEIMDKVMRQIGSIHMTKL